MNIDTNGFELEDVVRDKVSGFEGKITGFTQWTTGCARAAVMPRMTDKLREEGSMPKMWDVDVLNLELVEAGPRRAQPASRELVGATKGGPPTLRER